MKKKKKNKKKRKQFIFSLPFCRARKKFFKSSWNIFACPEQSSERFEFVSRFFFFSFVNNKNQTNIRFRWALFWFCFSMNFQSPTLFFGQSFPARGNFVDTEKSLVNIAQYPLKGWHFCSLLLKKVHFFALFSIHRIESQWKIEFNRFFATSTSTMANFFFNFHFKKSPRKSRKIRLKVVSILTRKTSRNIFWTNSQRWGWIKRRKNCRNFLKTQALPLKLLKLTYCLLFFDY